MIGRAVCMLAVVGAEIMMEDIAAYFPLANGEAVDDMFSMVTCEAPLETKVDPVLDEAGFPASDETPNNDAEPTEHWDSSSDTTASLFTGDDWFECDSSVTADVSGGAARTVCVWANIMEVTDGGLWTYGDRRADCGQYGFRTARPDTTCGEVGCLQVNMWGADCDLFVDFDPAWEDTWWHYCTTYDGETAAIYVNATMVVSAPRALNTGEASAVGDAAFGETPFYIGYNDVKTRSDEFSSFFEGAMSDLYIFTKVLTPEEMMDVAMGGFTPPDTPPPAMMPTINGTMNVTMNGTNMSWY